MTLEDAFGRVLRDRRIEMDLTQTDLARAGIISRSFISRLESGQLQVCIRNIFYLAEALKMEPGELIDRVAQLMRDE